MVAWNTQIFIFGWCENILMGISCVLTISSRKVELDSKQSKDWAGQLAPPNAKIYQLFRSILFTKRVVQHLLLRDLQSHF
jgi:hypothetical protein